MKVIRLMFLLSVLCLGAELMAQGQGEGRPGRRGQGINMDTLQVKLSLSDDQLSEFKVINEGMRAKRREIFEASNGDRESMREQMRELRASTEQEIKDILTVEQWTKYEVFREELRARRPEGRKKPGKKKPKGKKDTSSN